MDYIYFLKTFLLSIGLAMDACIISLSSGINLGCTVKISKLCLMALSFAFFQAIMPIIGFFLGSVVVEYIKRFIPYMVLVILLFFGIRMIISGVLNKEKVRPVNLSFWQILCLSFVTSIDSLSIGLTFAEYSYMMLFVSAVMIAVTNFILSIVGALIGKRFGKGSKNKAEIIGGVVLVVMGIEIFILSIL